MVNVSYSLFFRYKSEIASLQAVFSNQGLLAPRPSRAGAAIPKTPRPWNPSQWLKSSFWGGFVLWHQNVLWRHVKKVKILERFLGFGVSYVHRMTPNEVETASVAPYSPALSDTVRFFEPVQIRSPTPALPLRKVLLQSWSELCDW